MANKKIAIVGPLTGPRSAYGDLLTSAANAALSAHPISAEAVSTKAVSTTATSTQSVSERVEFVYMDDQALPHVADAVAKALIEEGVTAVIGHFNSACAATVKDQYENAGIVFVLPASTGDDLTEQPSRYRFRLCASNTKQCEVVAELLDAKSGSHTVVSDGSPYAEGLATVLASTYGYRVIHQDNLYEQTVFDFDNVFLAGTHFSCANMLNHLNQHTFTGRVVGCDDCDIEEFETLLTPPYSIEVMKLDKGFEFYIRHGVKAVLDILYDDSDVSNFDMADRLRCSASSFRFNEYGDNTLSTWHHLTIKEQ